MWKQYHIDNLDMENVCNYNYKYKENIYNNFYTSILILSKPLIQQSKFDNSNIKFYTRFTILHH